ncbi:MAG: FG-GAP-like repeat-containing protein [Marinoscillum sp.]|uniref:FG-GAP-like repeat-containing protein n=1 Tax=Marinoscillum sp. TaxID=2024838 RepID=UPI0032F0E2F3
MKGLRAIGYVILMVTGTFLQGQNFSKVTITAFEAMTDARAEWVDFNNDNYLDLFVSGTNNGGTFKVVVYFNNGDDTFSALTIANLDDVAYDFGDYNHDTYIDILLSGVDSGGNKYFTVYKNNSGTSFSAQSFGLSGFSRGGVKWYDVDQDGDLDILSMGLNASNQRVVAFYEYTSASYQSVATSIAPLSNGVVGILDANQDGIIEVLFSGFNTSGDAKTAIYSLSKEWESTLYTGTLEGYALNSYGLGDYDEDGFVDLLMTGFSESASESSDLFTNNQVNSFIQESPFLQDLSASSVDFGDVDNDGLLDILLTGLNGSTKYIQYYQNAESAGSYSFSNVAVTMENIFDGDIALGDYDNDGDLDVFQVGNSDLAFQANLYESDMAATRVNAAPNVPVIVSGVTSEDSVTLTWNAATDDRTAAASVTYNFYISTNPSGSGLVVAPLSNLADGYRQVMLPGNARNQTSFTVHQLPEGIYYWGVQAVDNNFKGSDFATEESFTVCYAVNMGNDTTICKFEYVELEIADPEVDVVNWFTKTDGLVLSNSLTYNHQALKQDTVIAEITKTFGCTVYDTLIVEVYDLPSFDLGNYTTICYGEYFDLSVSDLGIVGLDSVNWYSTGLGSLLQNNESLSYEVLTKDTLIAEVFNVNGCVNWDTLIVEVYDLPLFNLGNDTTICYGQYFDLSVSDLGIVGLDSVNWYSTGLGSLIKDNESLSYEVLTKDTLIAEVFNVNGCVNWDTLIVEVYDLPSFNLGNDTTICYGQYFELSVSDLGIVGLDSVNWYSTGLGSLIKNNESLSYEVLTKDTLIAEVFNVNGCVNWDTLIVEVYDLPSFDLGNDTTICYGQYFDLSVSDLGIIGLDSVNWYSTGLGSLLQNNESLSYEVLTRDTLIAEVFNVNGCVNWDTLVVEVYDLPSFNLGNDTTICYGQYFDLSVSDLGIDGLDSVNWYSTGLGSLLQNNESLSYEVLTKDTLIAEVFNVNGCVNWDTLIVEVYDLPSFNLGNDSTICYGQYFELSVSDLGIVGLDSVNWYSTGLGSLIKDNESLSYEVLTKDTLIAEVFNLNGCVNWDTLIVDVFALPVFDIGKDTSVCFELSILLETGPLYDEVNWYSRYTGEELQSESWFFNYQVIATDTLIAEVYDVNRCLNFDTIRIEMDPLPDHTLGPDEQICFLDTVHLAVTGSWPEVNWYTDGDQLLQADQVTYDFKVEETIEIWSEVYSAKGCVQYDTIQVEMLPLPTFDLPEESVYCFGDTITSDVGSIGQSYEWRDGQQNLLSEASLWETVATESLTVSLLVTDENACTYSDTTHVLVNVLPQFTIQGDPVICQYDSTTLSIAFDLPDSTHWYTASGSLFTNTESVRLSPDEHTWVFADLIDQNECLWTDSVEVIVNERPLALAGRDTLICYGGETLLGADDTESDWTYQWTPALGLSQADLARPLATPESTMAYQLEVINAEGCNAIDSVWVQVNPKITVDAGSDVAICLGDTIAIGGVPSASGSLFGYQYSWRPNVGLKDIYASNPQVSPEVTTRYYLEVYSGYCPPGSDSVLVTVNYAPEITVSAQQSVGPDESVMLSADGGVAYVWTPENTLDDPFSATPQASPLETTLYTVQVTDENGCESVGQVNVLVQNVMFIPNLFTPNGDNSNDTFLVYGSGIATIDFQVYDLNGNRLYHTRNVEEAIRVGWDGTYQGAEMANGTYMWSISGRFHNGAPLKFNGQSKGTIKLLR